jgi:hypothetical protein
VVAVVEAGSFDHHGSVKRTTAINHVIEMGEVAIERAEVFGRLDIEWPLAEMWVAGELLSFADPIDHGTVVLVLDLPAVELPRLVQHPSGEFVGVELRLGKRPVRWSYRPATWPVWTHDLRRLVRFWTIDDGVDESVTEAMRSRRLDGIDVVEASDQQVFEQAREELVISKLHMATVLDRYWDRAWRKANSGYDRSTEDTLWRAAQAVRELQEVVDGGELR